MMQRRVRKFLTNQSGASAIEFAFIAPVLLLVLLGSITAFDMFRTAQNVEKVTFTIGDMLAREQGPITGARLDEMLVLMRNTVHTASDGGLRVSSIGRSNGSFVLRWSEHVGDNLPDTPIPTSMLPEIANGDSILLTESFVPHEAMVAGFGITDVMFTSNAAHRPRFLSAINFQR